MAKKITGIDYAIEKLEKLEINLEDKTRIDGDLKERVKSPANVPRIRIVHIDEAWYLPAVDDPPSDGTALLSGLNVSFLTEECREINRKKCELNRPLFAGD